MTSKRVDNYLGKEGALSSGVEGFEFRHQQMDMAVAVEGAFDNAKHLIVEAGTGTGKSLAYLIPAILWAVENNKKVVISTYTKTLQHQILNHDIPFLRDKLGIAFRYALCMGNENYLSLRRLKRSAQAGLFTQSDEENQWEGIFNWAGETETGFRSDLPFEVLPQVWEEVGRQKDLCLGKNCETHSSCFYFKARKKWFGAHLLIVNHHLFFANVANAGAVLPAFDAVVFDEAQNLEEAATQFLGLEISNSSLIYFLDRLHNPRTRRGLLTRIDHDSVPHLRKLVMAARQAADVFFNQLLEEYGTNDRVLRFYKPPVLDNGLYVPLEALREALKSLEGGLHSEEDRVDASSAAERCFEFNNALSAILNQHMRGYVYWLEITPRKRFHRVVLRGVPIHVAEELHAQVFEKIDRIVMTSATLTTSKGFGFIKERIGYQPDEELSLDAPFNYPSQAMLYVPADLPEPGDEAGIYVEGISNRCRELVEASGGKTFILFTSYALLNQVYEKLDGLRFPLIRQGEMPTVQMIKKFKEKPSVIFGTNSFWQGVDIPGDALQSVIITKLPFDVPKEPLTEARIEELRRQHIDPFRHYQIPRAIIQLKQGFGRLIRKKTDTGVVSILDSRISRRGYGKQFIASLPPCPVVTDLEAVRNFFALNMSGQHGNEQ
ncbi:MAG: ATP-dependent DNA helicase [Nitrospinae bacterium]|nr:ATP-dependent DNA helicase [Nitrospinota bacterium]MBL7019478.1 ATP-dependent DNA helicase [Nitrospinaceae bacterium]